MLFPSRSKSFTLLELLIVIGIIAVLSTALIMVIRPAEQFRKGRDSSRVSQLDSLRTALNMALMENVSLGEDHTVYLSLPSNDPSCSDLSLPPLPNLWTYHCSNSQNFRKIDGTGWIPINFTELVTVNLPALPIDPLNNTTYYFTYTTGGSYELTALLESSERHEPAINDGDAFPGLYAVGTSLNLTPRTRDLGLVGYWPLDETSWINDCSTLTVQDSSGYGNHGKACPNGYGPVTAPGKVGNAGSFDGTDDYAQAGIVPIESGDNFSVAGWINPSDWGTRQNDSPVYNGLINLYHRGGLKLYFMVRLVENQTACGQAGDSCWGYWAAVRSLTDFQDNVFYHVVGVKNGNNLAIYVNEKKEREIPALSGWTVNYNYLTNLWVGRGSWGYYKGLVDDVRIYNRALSAEEIQAIYNATK